MPTATEIKKALREAGLEVYRTKSEVVHLADRVRENLLMDANIFIRAGCDGGDPQTPGPAGRDGGDSQTPGPAQPAAMRVGFVVRAQRNDFPNDGEPHLFDRARALAARAVDRGYEESSTAVHKILDPGDGQRTLDTWCEVCFEKTVADLEGAIVEARFALTIPKAVAPTVDGAPVGERAPDRAAR